MSFITIMRMLDLEAKEQEKTTVCQTKTPTELFPMGAMTFAVACAHCKNLGSDVCVLCKMQKVSGFELKQKKRVKVRKVKREHW